jgi:hypothetical protein
VTPPIIIIHRGDSPYLAHCIAQAKSSNPESRVILLGDQSNRYYLGVEHHYYKDYFIEAENFASIFQYKYFPTYQYSWILFCHQKYFALRDFCKKQKITKFVLIDSDVMIYEDLGAYFRKYEDSLMTLICDNPNAHIAGAWFAIVQQSSILDALCEIYTNLFSDSGKEIRDRLKLDKFYEMTGLYLLMEGNPGKIGNMYRYEGQDYVMNVSMEWDDRFEYEGKFLKVVWQKNIPYLTEKVSGRLFRAPMLHFHGKGKYVMGKYLRLKNLKTMVEHKINKVINVLAKYPVRLINTFHEGFFPKI